jgi:hypothetical protein
MKTLALLFVSFTLWGQNLVQTRYDVGQAGVNSAETALTPANVGGLTKLGTWNVSGFVMAQPLITRAIAGKDLLIVATVTGNVYALDANAPGTTIWKRTFPHPRTSYLGNSGINTFGYSQPLGIMSTPYADVVGGYLYVVFQSNAPQYTLYQLSLSTGSIVKSVVITGSAEGTGDPTGGDCVSGGVVSFCPGEQYVQRPGLIVANSKIYIAFGATDVDPYHGWVFAYNTSDLSRAAAWCSTAGGGGGSVWMAGAAPSVDGSGNLYVTTGNGDWNGTTNYSESVVKLSPTLVVLDYFTPSNWSALNTADADVSSNHFMLIPGTKRGVFAAKDYQAYVVDTSCMGHLQGSSTCSLQNWDICSTCAKTKNTGGYGEIFLNNVWYLPTTGDDSNGGVAAGSLYGFGFSGSTFNTSPVAANINTWPFPGPAQITGTSNGAVSSLIWAVTGASETFDTTSRGTVRVFDTSLTELWNSGSGSNALGLMSKYVPPTVINGRVYVPTQSGNIVVYGLPTYIMLGSTQLYLAISLPLIAIMISMLAGFFQMKSVNGRLARLESSMNARLTSVENRLSALDKRLS